MLYDFFQSMLHYIHQHPHLGELFAFLISFSESLPIIGTIIPGSITMTAIGTLVGAAILPGFTTLLWASVGALTGDCVGFWIGRHFDQRIRTLWPFSKYPKWLATGESFVGKHGGKSVVIGRFVGPARSTVPMVAGLLKLPWSRFLLAAAPSAVLWAILYLTPGILLGALSLELPPKVATEFVLIGLVVIVLLWLLFWIVQRFFREIARYINGKVDRWWATLNRHHSSQWFIRFITNRQNPNDHHQLTLSLLVVISGLLFIPVWIVVATHNAAAINTPLFHFFQSLRLHILNRFFIAITLLGRPVTMLIIGLVMTAGLAIKKQWRASWYLLMLLVTTAAAVFFIKHITYSPRPTGFMIVAKNSSFPSGHTTLSFVVLSFFAFLTASQLPKKYHFIPYTIAALLALLVGFSRLYLGAHWFLDVLGSYLLGFSILLAVITCYRRMPKALSRFTCPPLIWYLMLTISILVPWTLFCYVKFDATLYRYTPKPMVKKISIQAWWQNPTQALPIYRDNRFGRPAQPFNVQWAGKLNQIKKKLSNHDWKTISFDHPRLKYMLQRFTVYRLKYHLPLLPWIYQHHPPALIMIKHVQDSASTYEIRFWQTNISFTNSPLPLWIGAINYHALSSKKVPFTRRYHISFGKDNGLKLIAKNLPHEFVKTIIIPPQQQPKKIHQLHWNGHILVLRSA